MKKLATILVGFIVGLAISGVLGDLIVLVSNSAGRMSAAMSISKAEKLVAGGNFSEAFIQYEKALTKIKPDNKKLLAKTKNNMALCMFVLGENEKSKDKIQTSIALFSESLNLYNELNDAESAAQTKASLNEAQSVLKKIK